MSTQPPRRPMTKLEMVIHILVTFVIIASTAGLIYLMKAGQ